MTRKTLRQAVKSLGQALDDPRFDDWDDAVILAVLGEIIDQHRHERDRRAIFDIHGAQVMSDEELDRMIDKVTGYFRRDDDD
jgi:hypothetical protein